MEGKAIVNEMPLNTKRDKSKETTDLKYKEKISTRARISAWVSRIIIQKMLVFPLFSSKKDTFGVSAVAPWV